MFVTIVTVVLAFLCAFFGERLSNLMEYSRICITKSNLERNRIRRTNFWFPEGGSADCNLRSASKRSRSYSLKLDNTIPKYFYRSVRFLNQTVRSFIRTGPDRLDIKLIQFQIHILAYRKCNF